jgi:hypothetical protein
MTKLIAPMPVKVMDKPETYSSLVPFSGFYCSLHSDAIDSAEQSIFTHGDGTEMPSLLYETFYRSCDYSSVHEAYARQYVACLSKEIGIGLEFEEMSSPRYYNFSTDRLFAKISRKDLAKMLWAVKGKRLKEKVKQLFTSCSGFISSYSNDIKDWGRIATWDHNQIGAVFSAYVDKLEAYSGSVEDDVLQELASDGQVDDWLYMYGGDDGRWAIRTADFLRRFREGLNVKQSMMYWRK